MVVGVTHRFSINHDVRLYRNQRPDDIILFQQESALLATYAYTYKEFDSKLNKVHLPMYKYEIYKYEITTFTTFHNVLTPRILILHVHQFVQIVLTNAEPWNSQRKEGDMTLIYKLNIWKSYINKLNLHILLAHCHRANIRIQGTSHTHIHT